MLQIFHNFTEHLPRICVKLRNNCKKFFSFIQLKKVMGNSLNLAVVSLKLCILCLAAFF